MIFVIRGSVPLPLATIVSGPLSDRLGRRRLFIFLSGATLAAALVIPWAVPALAGIVLCLCGASAVWPIRSVR
ncbi:hypothetical protein [Streptosporangium minutum]|uniref:Major facilitator superfamily (MFS) profile domain-containing protein n=1 Tax=Streptosporangium minutum TaxID=569862 RepID=A0A243RP28_9ACTN|nr:hypothetical protein [Streptosporangium minutum]OUC96735.1 hypothetical protein CA984_13925 [Streptosporangium minutum]